MSLHICNQHYVIISIKVIPPSSIEFNYVSSDTLERMILLVSRMVVNFTNELRQIITNFYQNIDILVSYK